VTTRTCASTLLLTSKCATILSLCATQVRLDTAKLLKPDPPLKTPRTVGRPLTEWQVTHALRQQQQRLSCSASLDGLDSFFSASMAMMSLDKQQAAAGDDWCNKDSSTTMARPHSLSNLKESRGASRREASRGMCCFYMCTVLRTARCGSARQALITPEHMLVIAVCKSSGVRKYFDCSTVVLLWW
jgi:hypothetical protein